jgi:hypothetical protein
MSTLLISCEDDNITPINPGETVVYFSTQVQPIINQNCNLSGCHGFIDANAFQLLTHKQIDSAVIFSNLLLAIKHISPKPMPRIIPFLPDAVLMPDSLIQLIETWINQGRQNN